MKISMSVLCIKINLFILHTGIKILPHNIFIRKQWMCPTLNIESAHNIESKITSYEIYLSIVIWHPSLKDLSIY